MHGSGAEVLPVIGDIDRNIFQVNDQGRMSLPEAEHNRNHDRIAAELGNIIERNPQIMEVFPNNIQPDLEPIPESANTDQSFEHQREKQTD
ncbi:hypothetical protein [Moorena sp. SIO4G3]|uniref:hypothetical protein n=1 Tax=Moorena sp. SIO4G3 TaxID=2607821 RepID=UPI00142A9C3F|nr:hypothetical protein [Moorena sp. SIO4G3]NEO79507.1 hypothetical protein [Moorena sp. SIO4G3]